MFARFIALQFLTHTTERILDPGYCLLRLDTDVGAK